MRFGRFCAQVIRVAKRMGKYIGICGQGPSDHPDLCQFLVEEGIESISLSADRILPTIGLVHQAEQAVDQAAAQAAAQAL
jgi:pyruvate,water dikinase